MSSRKKKQRHQRNQRARFNRSTVSQVTHIPYSSSIEKASHPDSTAKFYLGLFSNDDELLEHVRTQWQLGDWEKIALLDHDTLEKHADKAVLSLLIASAQQQLGNQEKAYEHVQKAISWGCPTKVVARILINGVHNTLGKISVLQKDNERIKRHFSNAVSTNAIDDQSSFISYSRAAHEMMKMGFTPQLTSFTEKEVIFPHNKPPAKQKPSAITADEDYFVHKDWNNHTPSVLTTKGYSAERIFQTVKHRSFIGEGKNYIYISTPKAACTTMKWILCDIEKLLPISLNGIVKESTKSMGIHYKSINPMQSLASLPPSQVYKLLKSSNVVRFCIVRNPYARIVSAWNSKIRQKEPGYEKTCSLIAKFNSIDEKLAPEDFSGFVNWLVNKNTPGKCNAHWQPMSYILIPEVFNYTNIIRLESITEDFQLVLDEINSKRKASELLRQHQENTSLPVDWQNFYTSDLAEKVYKFYHSDFDTFGYTKDSWIKDKSKIFEKKTSEITIKNLERFALKSIRDRNEVISHLYNTTIQNFK